MNEEELEGESQQRRRKKKNKIKTKTKTKKKSYKPKKSIKSLFESKPKTKPHKQQSANELFEDLF